MPDARIFFIGLFSLSSSFKTQLREFEAATTLTTFPFHRTLMVFYIRMTLTVKQFLFRLDVLLSSFSTIV